MRREIIFIILFIVLFMANCSKRPGNASNNLEPAISATPEEPTPIIPAWPYIGGCADEIRLRFPVKGHTELDSGFVWLQILNNDSVLINSEPTPINGNVFSRSNIFAFFQRSQLPPDTYDLMLYISRNVNDVGQAPTRITAAGPYKFALDYSLITDTSCIRDTVFLGDTVYFSADSVVTSDSLGYRWDIHASRTYVEGNFYFIYEIEDAFKKYTNRCPKLSTNMFFPLKMSRLDSDSVTWIVTLTRQRLPGENDYEKAFLYVYPPSKLGNIDNDYDTTIIRCADSFGIPPQVIKAMIWQESKFDNFSLRYEMNYDYDYIQSRIKDTSNANVNIYGSHYFLADWNLTGSPKGFTKDGDSVEQGDHVNALQRNPYNALQFWSEPDVNVVDSIRDYRITAWDLYIKNPGQNWRFPSYDFVAQVIISSSYGLMHLTYMTALDEGYGSKDPQDLVFGDTLGIIWGVKRLRHIYYNSAWVNPNYIWGDKWKTAIGKYNGGTSVAETNGVFTNSKINDYVNSVLTRAGNYRPY
ncbi:hypothetical protein TRIP_C20148 [Candidatus Zixiibacteriota bacterium]|nr:hypothetical protein TRIP_C20148 [candidate division Zixibacteria bacterium]